MNAFRKERNYASFSTIFAAGGNGYTKEKHCLITKTVRAMQLTAVILLGICLQATAAGYSQSVTFSGKNVSLERVFKVIKQQTGYETVYDQSIARQKVSTINAYQQSLDNFLAHALTELPYEFVIESKTVFIREKVQGVNLKSTPTPFTDAPPITIRGRVIDENGAPVIASIVVKGTNKGVTSSAEGYFALTNTDQNATLIVTATNIEKITIELKGRTEIIVNAKKMTSSLDEVVINKGYYSEKQRLSTGSVYKVEAKEIGRQPVTSPLMALQGRVPGLNIVPSTGVAGSAVTVEIRGRNSVRFNGAYPLYVVDGIPIDSRPLQSNNGYLFNGAGFDPIGTINPANIESIEILKDADATSIYGSRGANGVIIITTKTGKRNEKINVDFAIYGGYGKAARFLDVLNTRQYIEMRSEAFQNANQTPTPQNAFDLLVWDTTRYTNWQKDLFGNKAKILDIQANVSGGNDNTSYRFGISHHKEGMIFPGNFGIGQNTANVNLATSSNNKKFRASVSGSYGLQRSNAFSGVNLVGLAMELPPNAPKAFNEDGSLNWENSTWNNPYSFFQLTANTETDNLIANVNLSYEIIPNLWMKANFGYTTIAQDGVNKTPLSSLNPATISPNSTASTVFESNRRRSWIIEPQILYTKNVSDHTFDLVVGSTWQKAKSAHLLVEGTGYVSDILLGSLQGATKVQVIEDANSDYRYSAVYGRLGYNFKEKYIVNFTGRRDGSSRFGTNNQFANFGAFGFAWIFSKEKLLKENLGFINFGKLRGSYGSTGNDQIGDYKYLSAYAYTPYSYHGSVGLYPTALENADYAWEITKKLEMGLELGLLNDRLILIANWFRNRSGNQLLDYPLPTLTGFGSIFTNLDALIENKGFEFYLQTLNLNKSGIRWTSSLNLTIPRNKLIEFENLENSSYANFYVVGQSISTNRTFTSLGVNPNTGYYEVEDVNQDGVIDNRDYNSFVNVDRKIYGGLLNTIQYRNFELSFLFQFVQKKSSWSTPLAGQRLNLPTYVLDRWRKVGDEATYQKYSTGFDIFTPINYQSQGNGFVGDGSFTRLKTFSVAYQVPAKLLTPLKCSTAKIFMQGQNLFTITNDKSLDPETGNYTPLLRMLTVGLEVRF